MNYFLIFCYLTLLLAKSEDFYKVLGISRNADQDAIKKAFKKMSLKYHPDKNKDNPKKAQEQFQKVVNAYETLKVSALIKGPRKKENIRLAWRRRSETE